ncbi:hypothetical protein EIK80_23505 [Caulobacter sp. 602-1]|nr:hypothetical protein EIK80_23505 [Caulobacter sp. 602-1]
MTLPTVQSSNKACHPGRSEAESRDPGQPRSAGPWVPARLTAARDDTVFVVVNAPPSPAPPP